MLRQLQQVHSFNLMFEDMYFTILGTYLVTEPPFVTSVFTPMGRGYPVYISLLLLLQQYKTFICYVPK